MFAMKMTFKSDFPFSERAVLKAQKHGCEVGVREWHAKLHGKHFRHEAQAFYGYMPRKPYTIWEKKKKYGHTRPLVKTGNSKKLLDVLDIRGTATGARIISHARTMNFHPHLLHESGAIHPTEVGTVLQPAYEKGVIEVLKRSRRKRNGVVPTNP